jgi:hypothetical protein
LRTSCAHRFSAAKVKLMSAAPRALKTCILLSCLILGASCSRWDRANQARAEEIKKLSKQTFKQAAEDGRCDHDDCSRQEAGFAFAKKNSLGNPDECYGKGDKADEGFMEGCRQYGENIEAAYAGRGTLALPDR